MSLTEIYYTHTFKSCHYFPLTDNKEDNLKKNQTPQTSVLMKHNNR